MKIFIVYGLINPLNNQIFYIGKGRKNRPSQHLTEAKSNNPSNPFKTKILQEIINHGMKPIINIYLETKDEKEALILERNLISTYGKIQTGGILTNMLDGGFKNSGYITTQETKNKISMGLKLKYYHNPELKEKTIEPLLELLKQKPELITIRNKNISISRKISDKVKQDVEKRKNIERTNETKNKISASKMGHEVSDTTKMKISNKLKGRKLSIETRLKMSESIKFRDSSWKNKISIKKMGHEVSDETKETISKSLLNSDIFKTSMTLRNEKYKLLKDFGIPTRNNIIPFIHIHDNKITLHSSKETFAKIFKCSTDTISRCLKNKSDKFNVRYVTDFELSKLLELKNLIMTGRVIDFNPILLGFLNLNN